MTTFTGRRAELKEKFVQNRGYWTAFWDSILVINPDFFESYLAYSSIPWTPGVLPAKVKEFVYIAIDVATTHLYEPGLRIHIQNAVKHGATPEEIMEVLMLCASLGIHTLNMGVPILVEELNSAGRGCEINRNQGLKQQSLRKDFESVRGFWAPYWDDFLALDPDFFEAYLNLSAAPWRTGVLDPKVKEFINIAINSSVTHLYAPALRIHIRQALKHGASAAEIMEVFQLTSVLGMHSCTLGVPALTEELAKLGHMIQPTPQTA